MQNDESHRRATRDRFDQAAPSYDTAFTRLIDKYDEMLDLALALVGELRPGARRFLDLGMGTGAVSERILEAFPDASVHGVDFSERMADQARIKLARFGGRFSCEIADLAEFRPRLGARRDVVMSTLAIHHLTDPEKRRLTTGICRTLAPGGVFLNGDLLRGGTDREQEALVSLQARAMRVRGIAEEDIRQRLRRHREHDIPARLADQIAWLREAGCEEVWVPWRHLNQALIVGLIPSATRR